MLAGRRYLVVAVAVLATAVCARKEETPAPTPTPERPKVFTARALRDITVPRTPERVERGKYLSEGLLQCFVCHSERDWKKPGAPPILATKGAGYVWRAGLTAPNLTPDKETGTGTWTDDMLIRAIREGISHDGRVLHRQMWYASFRTLPDEDVEAIVAYLRSLKPIRNPLPRTTLTEKEVKDLEVPEPLTLPAPPGPPVTDVVERGRRLAWLADCSGCHTSWHTPKNPGLYGGGNLIERGDLKTYSANITSDDSGITHYDAAFFREVMRTGKARGRELSPLMPWTVFRNLNDEDLDALFAYLRALPKVKHVIDNIDKPTKCVICENEHPLGQYNKPPEIKLVSTPLAELKDTVGTYRAEDGFQFDIAIENGKFMVKFSKDDGCELVTENRRVYFCQGAVERIEFVRDASGKVTGLTNILEPARKIK
ncbi:MAG TPA: c-type cytochrome [Vicinamibacterales bacterium]|nr:c-type cytochrome [Vicinamibacterales bacterium]